MYKLAVDLDGTAQDYESGLAFIVTKARGLQRFDLPLANTWGFDNWNMSRDEFMEHHTNFVRSGGFRNLVFYPGFKEALTMLKWDGVHISIVTHRLMVPGEQRNIVKDTVDSLHDAEIPYDDLLFVEDKSVVDFNLIVEDAPHQHQKCTSAGKDVLIFDQLYNRDIEGPRVTDWQEAYDVINYHKSTLDSSVMTG